MLAYKLSIILNIIEAQITMMVQLILTHNQYLIVHIQVSQNSPITITFPSNYPEENIANAQLTLLEVDFV